MSTDNVLQNYEVNINQFIDDFKTNRIVEQEGSRIKKKELVEEFKCYVEKHGKRPPKFRNARRLYEAMNNKFGEYNHDGQYNNGWKNVTLIYDSEDDEDERRNEREAIMLYLMNMMYRY